jgi:hypothetical protein
MRSLGAAEGAHSSSTRPLYIRCPGRCRPLAQPDTCCASPLHSGRALQAALTRYRLLCAVAGRWPCQWGPLGQHASGWRQHGAMARWWCWMAMRSPAPQARQRPAKAPAGAGRAAARRAAEGRRLRRRCHWCWVGRTAATAFLSAACHGPLAARQAARMALRRRCSFPGARIAGCWPGMSRSRHARRRPQLCIRARTRRKVVAVLVR